LANSNPSAPVGAQRWINVGLDKNASQQAEEKASQSAEKTLEVKNK